MGMDAIISLPGLATTAITGTLTLTKPGTTPRTATFPDASIEVQGTHDVQSSNWQARNHGLYTAIASATVTDPGTPAAGHEFTTLVRNGTLTTSRGTYSVAGTLVQSVWHSGSWTDYPYGPLNAANTWTAAQTIDRGTGTLPSPINPANQILTLANTGSGASNIEGFGFAITAMNIRGRAIGGTRASPTATTDQLPFINLAGVGYDGTAHADSAAILFRADGLWSGTNRGAFTQFMGIANGSTTQAEWMRLQNAALAIGGNLPTAGNGLLQLASGTTKANGIAFGTDTFLYRTGAGSAAVVASSGASTFSVYDSTFVSQVVIYADSGGGVMGQAGNKALSIRTNNTTAINIDTLQGITTAAANYVKTRSITSAAGTTTLDSTDDTAILTGATTHTFTLPASAVGRRIFVKNRSSGALTVNRAGADTIDGGTTLNVAAGTAKILIVNGTDWCVWNA